MSDTAVTAVADLPTIELTDIANKHLIIGAVVVGTVIGIAYRPVMNKLKARRAARVEEPVHVVTDVEN